MRTFYIVFIFIGIVVKTAAYVVYCPCMGRFGNQADQFLGTLRFAKEINRTLVLPPWIEYENVDWNLRPFTHLFQLKRLLNYHRVIPMDEFMRDIAPSIWPKGSRKVFCYSYRDINKGSCDAKNGRPFFDFWNYFDVDFDESIAYGPLSVSSHPSAWITKFPVEKYPVLAYVGAPGDFPINQQDTYLHKFMVWTSEIVDAAENIISTRLERPYVAIHLRNDVDFLQACRSIIRGNGIHTMFDSAQCHGYDGTTSVTMDQCYPPNGLVIAHTRQMLAAVGARALYVATDRDDLAETLKLELGSNLLYFASSNKVKTSPHVDLVLLGRANGAVLNCVSSFSAFARRERDSHGLVTEYFGFTKLRKLEL